MSRHMEAFLFLVGMGRFELPAPRPPDEYSNRTELHPELSEGKPTKNLSIPIKMSELLIRYRGFAILLRWSHRHSAIVPERP